MVLCLVNISAGACTPRRSGLDFNKTKFILVESVEFFTYSPQQRRVNNHAYRRLRVGAAHRELSRQRGQRYLFTEYSPAPSAIAAT